MKKILAPNIAPIIINQEIIGPPTRVPWAIVFGNPFDGSAVLPRHPVQLYEAFTYLTIFFLLHTFWKTRYSGSKPGFLVGFFLVTVFGFRFILEYFKEPTSLIFNETYVTCGQVLSIPFVLLGVYFWRQNYIRRQEKTNLLTQANF